MHSSTRVSQVDAAPQSRQHWSRTGLRLLLPASCNNGIAPWQRMREHRLMAKRPPAPRNLPCVCSHLEKERRSHCASPSPAKFQVLEFQFLDVRRPRDDTCPPKDHRPEFPTRATVRSPRAIVRGAAATPTTPTRSAVAATSRPQPRHERRAVALAHQETKRVGVERCEGRDDINGMRGCAHDVSPARTHTRTHAHTHTHAHTRGHELGAAGLERRSRIELERVAEVAARRTPQRRRG
jgi:hypothetical protein